MSQSEGERIRRGMNFLSMLGAKLRDLQGTATLAHELIQNAEDAVGRIPEPSEAQATIVFRIDDTALIVENQGTFSDCGDPHHQPCEWDKPCDFHGFTNVGSGRKRLEENQKGAFGFGFTAVYQITDHPELISSGRHWILEDEKPEDQRIYQCGGCERCQSDDLPGTRFILPWAFDSSSPVREALKTAAVQADGPQRFLQELLADLPHTLLFLDHIKGVKVFWNNEQRLHVSRQTENQSKSAITIVENGEPSKWMVLETDFETTAARLRATHPHGEKRPISTVKIAVPQNLNQSGLFFAFLPTQQPTGTPFHINADFFPTNDRKRLLLESDYQAEWNREAIRAGATALRNGLLSLQSHLGPKSFWQLINSLHLASNADSSGHDSLCKDYWKAVVPVLQGSTVIPTTDKKWATPSTVYFLKRKVDEDFAELHRALTLSTVHPDIRDFRELLTSDSVGVQELDAATLAAAFQNVGVSGAKGLGDLPEWFRLMQNWDVAWRQVSAISSTTRPTSNSTKAVPHPLAKCALVQCIDDVFRTCSDVYVVEAKTRELFTAIAPSLHFANDHEKMLEAVAELCGKFSVADAIRAVESASCENLTLHCPALLKWFNDRSNELSSKSDLIERLKKIAVCPTAIGLRPFSAVVLPGGFSDPIGVTDLVDVEAFNGLESLLKVMGLNRLSLNEYITERLPSAFKNDGVGDDACERLLHLLSEHQGEFLDSDDIHDTLTSLPFIQCTDGQRRAADNALYFKTKVVEDVLGDIVPYVQISNCTNAIRNLLEWLGVASKPILGRVVNYVIGLTACCDKPDPGTIEKVLGLFEHIGNRLDEIKADVPFLDCLKKNKWLPGSNRHWCLESHKWIQSESTEWAVPHELFQYRSHYLVESTARFIGFTRRLQDEHKDFLSELGVGDSPNANKVIQHLHKAAEQEATIDGRVYRFLNNALEEGAITAQQLSGLKLVKCLYDKEQQRSFKPIECFSEDHPFGTHRVRLTADTLSAFTHLLKALQVRPRPSWQDAMDVLCEISQGELARSQLPIGDDDKQVVFACWRLIETALRDPECDQDTVQSKLTAIASKRIVCRVDNLMTEPQKVFFRDREHLAEAFHQQLELDLIAMPQGASESLARAGVRKLSDVTTTEIIPDKLPAQQSMDVKSRLSERAPLLVRVMETFNAGQGKDNPDFHGIIVSEAATITVQYMFRGYPRALPSNRQTVLAIFDEPKNQLWYCREEASIPWDTIACELACMFLGTNEAPQLSAQISAVLEPDTLMRAERKLNRLGFPVIELAAATTTINSTATSFGVGSEESEAECDSTHITSGGSTQISSPVVNEVSDAERQWRGENASTQAADNSLNQVSSKDVSVNRRDETTSEHELPAKPVEHTSAGAAGSSIHHSTASEGSLNWENEPVSEQNSFRGHQQEPFIAELAGRPGANDRRQERVQVDSSRSDLRSSERLLREQRVNRIPKDDVLNYLHDLYARDGLLHCQMRSADEADLHRMPFRKKNGHDYWVRVELLNGKWAQRLPYSLPEYKSLFIVLCPNCSAIYCEYVRNLSHQQDRLFEWFASNDSRTTFDVKCSLNGKQPDRVLHFDPKHLGDIKAVKGIYDRV